jgi:hypothetical protein
VAAELEVGEVGLRRFGHCAWLWCFGGIDVMGWKFGPRLGASLIVVRWQALAWFCRVGIIGVSLRVELTSSEKSILEMLEWSCLIV